MQVRDLWEEYYSGADAIVFMVDSADRARFGEAKREIQQILSVEDIADVPILVLGNKIDLEVREEKATSHGRADDRVREVLTRIS